MEHFAAQILHQREEAHREPLLEQLNHSTIGGSDTTETAQRLRTAMALVPESPAT